MEKAKIKIIGKHNKKMEGKKNPDRREFYKAYYKANKKRLAESKKLNYQKKRKQYSDYSKAYRLKNIDKIKAYRLKNIDKIKAKAKEYYQKNKKHLRAYGKDYFKKKQEKLKNKLNKEKNTTINVKS